MNSAGGDGQKCGIDGGARRGAGFEVYGLGFRDHGAGLVTQVLEYVTQGSGFRV
jgi:hypothetical protein